jgi:hypothetical protein
VVLVGGLSDESMKFTAIMPQKAEVGHDGNFDGIIPYNVGGYHGGTIQRRGRNIV